MPYHFDTMILFVFNIDINYYFILIYDNNLKEDTAVLHH